MKIGIDISQIVYQTGVSRYTVELVKHLLDIDKKNHYFLYAGSLRQKQLLRSFIKEVKTSKVSSKITNLSPKLADLVINRLNLTSPDNYKDLDVVHASNYVLPKTKAKLVTTIHDLTFLKYPESHTKESIATHTRHLNRSKEHADIIITDAKSTKRDLIKEGIAEEKIKVIHLAPAKIFKPLSSQKMVDEILEKYQLKKPFILSVGTQEPRKNLKNLIKAYQSLNLKKTSLVIVGKFGWGEKVRQVPGVKLLGFVPDEDLVGLYQAAKVFIYPSLYEGFGFPILEAFACNCPVITSKNSSLPELGGDAATYINPRSVKSISTAIKKILKLKPSGRRDIINQATQQLKKFSWDKTARETLKVYQELVK